MDSSNAPTQVPSGHPSVPAGAIRRAALTTGIGLGGFVDGILFHQVLQFHHMLSAPTDGRFGVPTYATSTVEGLRVNTLWDGLFHVVAYLFVLVGSLELWRVLRELPSRRVSGRLLGGGLLAGWGVFNLVEGIVDHHLLQIHHVYAGDLQLLWDLLFLAVGVALLAGGWALSQSAPELPPGD